MRFALLGDHPDGLAMARALVASGRHELVAYCGPAVGAEYLRRWEIAAKRIGDMEEMLADPAIEAVIVAGPLADRAAQLRRALQSERHVLCVHPADDTPDIAYEAAMIQADTHKHLFAILPDALHPALRQFAELVQGIPASERFIEVERLATDAVLLETDATGESSGIPGWDALRLLGGEVVELMGFAAKEELSIDAPLMLSGRFDKGGLFNTLLLPNQKEDRLRISLRSARTSIKLSFPQGSPGPAQMIWQDDQGQIREEKWDNHDPWAAFVASFDATLAGVSGQRPNWQDEIRSLELDDAASRSVKRRRSSLLEYQEVSEEVGFKGTMTLVGCALLWVSLGILIASYWIPWLALFILPGIVLFLLLQALGWFVPPKPSDSLTPPVSQQAQVTAPTQKLSP